jgi:hypothetical protein
MNPLARFRGTAFGVVALAGALALWWGLSPIQEGPSSDAPQVIFAFEKEQLVRFVIERPQGTIEMRREGEKWTAPGQVWRPSAAMVRRVAHQLHDLTARAKVVERTQDPAHFGLGEDAITVRLYLEDGTELAFEVGDPNPSSVSWYLRSLPDGPVYVVKKAAVNYYRADIEDFREDRITFFDAGDAESIEVDMGGRQLAFERVDDLHWRMTAPEQWSANRDLVRRMMGSVSAARSQAFVVDQPDVLTPWGLAEGADEVRIALGSGEALTLRLGNEVEGTDPVLQYAWRAEDNAVYQVRAVVSDPFERPLEEYRNPRVVGGHAWEVGSMTVAVGGETINLLRSADEWRWADGGVIPGATPRRVAGAAADPRALEFLDSGSPDVGLDDPQAELWLVFENGRAVHLRIGASMDPVGDEREGRIYLEIVGQPPVIETSDQLLNVVQDLQREHGRKASRDAERHGGP